MPSLRLPDSYTLPSLDKPTNYYPESSRGGRDILSHALFDILPHTAKLSGRNPLTTTLGHLSPSYQVQGRQQQNAALRSADIAREDIQQTHAR